MLLLLRGWIRSKSVSTCSRPETARMPKQWIFVLLMRCSYRAISLETNMQRYQSLPGQPLPGQSVDRKPSTKRSTVGLSLKLATGFDYRAHVFLNTKIPIHSYILLRQSARMNARKIRHSKRVLRPGEAIKGLYNAFNDRNISAAASFLDDDCMYVIYYCIS